MPKAKAKPAEIVATMTNYVDQQQRLVIVLAVARGVTRAFAVSPASRGALTLQRAQLAATDAATAWAQERGGRRSSGRRRDACHSPMAETSASRWPCAQ